MPTLTKRALAALPLAALLASAGLPAQAQGNAPSMTQNASPTAVSTTAELAAMCQPTATGVARYESIAYCQGYVTAIGQMQTALRPAGGPRPPLYCLPDSTPSVAQSAISFSNWARQNPQHANEPAPDGLLRWAQATYPCPAAAAPAPRRATR